MIFWAVWSAVILLVLVFGFVVLVGAPYLPSRKSTCVRALKILDLKPGQTLYDLGCGDGVMLKLAAQAGLNAVGYEINPVLVLIARARTLRCGRRVSVRWGNYWRAGLNEADGIYVFLLDRYMARLDEKVRRDGKKGVKLTSYAFKIPGKKVAAKSGPLYLYQY